jgi:uncharacterized protein (TIGR02266 family)
VPELGSEFLAAPVGRTAVEGNGCDDVQNVISYFRDFARLDMQRMGAGLSISELERWSALRVMLDRELARRKVSRGDDRRASPRVNVRLVCSYASSEQLREAVISNLSTGGCFILTRTPLPIGSTLDLRIRIEECGLDVEVQGEVVSQNICPERGTDAQGMGIRFSQLSRDAIEELSAFYAQQAGRELAAARQVAPEPSAVHSPDR